MHCIIVSAIACIIVESYSVQEQYNNKWWGPAELEGISNTSIRPFDVVFDDDVSFNMRGHPQVTNFMIFNFFIQLYNIFPQYDFPLNSKSDSEPIQWYIFFLLSLKVILLFQMIKHLKYRINTQRKVAPPLEGTAFEYGFNSKSLHNWLRYWAEDYPFKIREHFFNQYPQFITNIQGLNIHFLRVKPKVRYIFLMKMINASA